MASAPASTQTWNRLEQLFDDRGPIEVGRGEPLRLAWVGITMVTGARNLILSH